MTIGELLSRTAEEVDNILTESGFGEIKIIISNEGRKVNIETVTNTQHDFEYLG